MATNTGNKTTPVLIVILVLFAFLTGTLWTKVRTLEKKKEVPPAASPEIQQQEEAKPVVLGVSEQAEIIKNAPGVKGPESAKVTIVEFSEFECPYCQKYVLDTYFQIQKDYDDKIRYVFRNYPLPFHTKAQITSEAAWCAADQGKFWEYHDKLFADKDTWLSQTDPKETLVGFATQLGLDGVKFRDCLTTGKYTQPVKNDMALGQKYGVSGTPSFFINGRLLVGAQPFSAFKTIIDEELAK